MHIQLTVDAPKTKLTIWLASAMVTYRPAEIVRAKEKIALINSAMTNERMTLYVQKGSKFFPLLRLLPEYPSGLR